MDTKKILIIIGVVLAIVVVVAAVSLMDTEMPDYDDDPVDVAPVEDPAADIETEEECEEEGFYWYDDACHSEPEDHEEDDEEDEDDEDEDEEDEDDEDEEDDDEEEEEDEE